MNGVLAIKNEQWGMMAGKILAAACDDDYPLDSLAADCQEGACSLFNVYENNQHIASFVMRIDAGAINEMVVVAAGGYLAHGSLYKLITPYVEQLAAANGCQYLRGHTKRKGVGRLMQRAGWEQSELIYRKKVTYGQQVIQ